VSYAELFIWESQIKAGDVSSRARRWGSEDCAPSNVQGHSPWSENEAPLKPKHFWLLNIQWIPQICYVF